MRKIIQAARQLRPALRCNGNFVGDGSAKRHDFWFNTSTYSIYSLARNSRVCECKHPSSYVVSRAISAGLANADTGGCINVFEFFSFNFVSVKLLFGLKIEHLFF